MLQARPRLIAILVLFLLLKEGPSSRTNTSLGAMINDILHFQ